MRNDPKKIVTTVLKVLTEQATPGTDVDKIVLHKFIYFLNTKGIPTGLSFEPYTYGPYSFELASTLRNLAFWDVLEENKSSVEVVSPEDLEQVDSGTYATIKELFDVFKEAVGDLNFTTLEIAGTILYCAESLSIQGIKPSEDAVVEEFTAWKGSRYPEAAIRRMHKRLKQHLMQ